MEYLSIRQLAAICVLSTVIGCDRPAGKRADHKGGDGRPRHDELVLKSYTVPPNLGEEITESLNRTLNAKEYTASLKNKEGHYVDKVVSVEPEIGRARLSGSSTIIISAPSSIHAGIPEFIDKVAASVVQTAKQVRLRTWAVAGAPVGKDGSKGMGLPEQLAAAVASYPDHCFAVIEEVSSAVSIGKRFYGEGAYLNVSGDIADFDKYFLTDLHVRGGGFRFGAQAKLQPRETVLLFSSAFSWDGVFNKDEGGRKAIAAACPGLDGPQAKMLVVMAIEPA